MNILKKLSFHRTTARDYSFSVTKEERDVFCTTIINSSSPRTGFYLLIILSTFIVVTGIIRESLILLIGGMLVAPLLSPILSISLSLAIINGKALLRSLLVFVISMLTTLISAMAIGLMIETDISQLSILEAIHFFDLSTLLIPIAAGAAASFTWAKRELNGSLPGVAITVTLLPPLATMGLALAAGESRIFLDSLNIYFLNVSGIIIGSLIIFLMMGFQRSAKTVIAQVDLENKEK